MLTLLKWIKDISKRGRRASLSARLEFSTPRRSSLPAAGLFAPYVRPWSPLQSLYAAAKDSKGTAGYQPDRLQEAPHPAGEDEAVALRAGAGYLHAGREPLDGVDEAGRLQQALGQISGDGYPGRLNVPRLED